MRKELLLLIFIFCNTVQAQVNNLDILKALSKFNAGELIEATRYDGWEPIRPTEEIEDGVARSIQKFIYDQDNEKQILKRTVVAYFDKGFKYVNTILISNNPRIKEVFTAELLPYETENSNKDYRKYDDGYDRYFITQDFNTENEFYEEFKEQGGFQISISQKLPL
ncbi:hypothetical protein MKO06_04380 [Gramella sp. GC03-9]|uniref:Uncharacterized protein n=1 Tax=Christiangramia oceanisediminis TaxID=2920386 RepID=A0A9X2I9E0_9FLAO|nr:hypothetical protein [Gramella oceanisediminis]MCP9199133.1 hypothetical protein [Gramella oceanisediminis]